MPSLTDSSMMGIIWSILLTILTVTGLMPGHDTLHICIGCVVILTALGCITYLVFRSRVIINRIAAQRLHSVREILTNINDNGRQ
jgi:hypothetical protein